MTGAAELDLRGVSAPRRDALLRTMLDALGNEESVIVMQDGDPRWLLSALANFPGGALEYCAVEHPNDSHAFEIRRASRRTLPEVLAFQHARLDKLLSEVEWRLEQRLMDDAKRRFAGFAVALSHHLECEERELFPLFQRLGESRGLRMVEFLGREHTVMRDLLHRISFCLRNQNEGGRLALCAISDLRELLGPHAAREESWLATALDGEDVDALRARVQEQLSSAG